MDVERKPDRHITKGNMRFFLLTLYFIIISSYIAAQTTLGPTEKKPEVSKATSKELFVHEKPDENSRIIGQLIYDETILIVKRNVAVTEKGIWVKITSPFEGYYLETKKRSMGTLSLGSDNKDLDQDSHFQSFIQSKLQREKSQSDETEQIEQESPGFFKQIYLRLFGPDEKEKIDQQETAAAKKEKKKTDFMKLLGRGRGEIWCGLGLGLYSIPEEKGYSSPGIPVDFHVEFLNRPGLLSKFRFGLNMTKSEKSGYDTSTNSLYAAYRINVDQINVQNTGAFAYAGLAWMMSTISGKASGSAQDFGVVLGAGGYYRLSDNIRIGGQYIYFSNQANFGNIKRYIGSTQIQLTGSMGF